jgi:hypothetical protein
MSDQRSVQAEDDPRAEPGGKGPNKPAYACSFCGKKQHQVWRLVAGPGVYICNECVLLCMEMFVEGAQTNLDDDITFRVAAQRPDGAADRLSFGPVPEPGYPTADHPGGEHWLHLCPACGAVNVGTALTTCLHCAEPLPRAGETINRPLTPWHIGFTRQELRSFTPQFRATLKCAAEEARQLHHEHIGTEHLLLGLLRQPDGVGSAILRAHGAALETVRQAITDIIQRGSEAVTAVQGYSRRARDVVRAAMAEAKQRGQTKVAPEHLLLALLAERKGVGAMALTALGVDLDAAQAQVVQRLAEPPA